MNAKQLTSISALIFLFFSCSDTEILLRNQDRLQMDATSPCDSDVNCPANQRCVGGLCVSSECDHDSQCLEDEICLDGKCVGASKLTCDDGRRALLDLSTFSINFGPVYIGEKIQRPLTIRNLGDCALMITEAKLLSEDGENSYSCTLCETKKFPLHLAPGRSINVEINRKATAPGPHRAQLVLATNDLSVGDSGKIHVSLQGDYAGNPSLRVTPAVLEWGYVPFSSSRAGLMKSVQISNQGSGNAAVLIENISIDDGTAFAFTTDFSSHQFRPTWLQPNAPIASNRMLEVPITFLPKGYKRYNAYLIFGIRNYGNQQSTQLRIPLRGTSEGVPQIQVSERELLFRSDDNGPTLPGSVTAKELRISNLGQAELLISNLVITPPSDFSFFPSFLSPIAPGDSATINVFFAPIVVKNGFDASEVFSVQKSQLHIANSDPAKPMVTTSLWGWVKNTTEETLSVEMAFENAQSGWASGDFRDVDLELISPTGFSCTKPKPIYSSSGNLTQQRDYCGEWNGFGQEGRVHWIAVGQLEKPERISLFGFAQNARQDQIFSVRVHYIEDCSNMPAPLLASALGIATSGLVSVVGGAAGATIQTSPASISEAISKHCMDHAPTLATIKILVNGRELSAPQTLLYKKGDSADVVKIRRINNHFEIVQ